MYWGTVPQFVFIYKLLIQGIAMPDFSDDFIIEHPVSIRQKVYGFLRDQILSNQIPAGTRLVEGRIAGQIHVSRTPIREALHVLEMEGLIESFPRVGYRVKELKWEDVEELCEIRAVNEILAARWALQHIVPKQLAAMKANIDAAEAEIQAGRNYLLKEMPNFTKCWSGPAAARGCSSSAKCCGGICCGIASKVCILPKPV